MNHRLIWLRSVEQDAAWLLRMRTTRWPITRVLTPAVTESMSAVADTPATFAPGDIDIMPSECLGW